MPGIGSQYRPSVTKKAPVSIDASPLGALKHISHVHPPVVGKRLSWRNGPGQYPFAVTMLGQRSCQIGIFLGDAGYLTRQRDETERVQPVKERRDWKWSKAGRKERKEIQVGTTPVYILRAHYSTTVVHSLL
jgi:hypothetical protein